MSISKHDGADKRPTWEAILAGKEFDLEELETEIARQNKEIEDNYDILDYPTNYPHGLTEFCDEAISLIHFRDRNVLQTLVLKREINNIKVLLKRLHGEDDE